MYDGFIGYHADPRLRIYVGQYNAPFTMENVTSSRWLDLMERSLIVRTLATPYNKADGLTVWGETRGNKSFEYQVGVFGGDGMNRPNIDNRFDGMGRVVVRPLASDGALERFHIGAGAPLRSRDDSAVHYDAPTLSTPGGYAFWSPVYTDRRTRPRSTSCRRASGRGVRRVLPPVRALRREGRGRLHQRRAT